MNLGVKAAALAVLGIASIAGATGAMNAQPAHAWGGNTITVYVGGPLAGTIDFDVDSSFLPDLVIDEDNGGVVMPTNYCGLRITHVGGIYWYDGSNNLVEAENHGEVTVNQQGDYMFMGEEITEAYLGGVEFTGALDTCDDNEPWYFPIPLSYGGNAPQYGAEKLVLQLDQPPSFQPTIEFLDNAMEPVELPDLYEDWEPPADWEDYCEKIPEFCEPKVNPDLVPVDLGLQVLFGCWTLGTCDEPSTSGSRLTLGCMAYADGCDPDPEPPQIFVAPTSPDSPDDESILTTKSTNLQVATR